MKLNYCTITCTHVGDMPYILSLGRLISVYILVVRLLDLLTITGCDIEES